MAGARTLAGRVISVQRLERSIHREVKRIRRQDLLTDANIGRIQGLKLALQLAITHWQDQQNGYSRHPNGARKKTS